MRKLFCVLTIILLLVFTACEQQTIDDDSSNLPTMTIRNQSSFDLSDVMFSGISFSAAGLDYLPRSTQSVKQLTADDVDKTGYITFSHKDIGIACRTEAITVTSDDYIFTFTDTTIVEELGNSSNRKPLSQIDFLPTLAVEHNGRSVIKGETVIGGESVVSYLKENEFTIKNTGLGKLTLGGNNPVRINGDTDVFTVIQPAGSQIASNGSMNFKINFRPTDIRPYNAIVTISSDDHNGEFSFIITAEGVPSKPIASVFYKSNEIFQFDTIDAGEQIITHSMDIIVEIKNTGTEILTIETAGITITGEDADAFNKLVNPNVNISAGGQSSLVIQYNPVKVGINNATLVIPVNDDYRNPVVIYLKGTAVKGAAVLELSQNDAIIYNNAITPFDFGRVELGASRSLTFTVKNTGNIALGLIGDPAVELSGSAFNVLIQPTNKTISHGATVSFAIQYTPTAEKEDTGIITILNDSDDMVCTFFIKGTGYVKKPQITVKQGNTVINQYGEYSFGSILSGRTSDVTFTIVNSGEADLTVEAVNGNTINLADNATGFYSVLTQSFASAVISPESTSAFIIRFNPVTAGNNFAAAVQIKTDSRDNADFYFVVKGDGRNPSIGDEGPGGGMIFFVSGDQYKECSAELGAYNWNDAMTTAQNYRGGNFTDWYLPDRGEVDLMYENLHRKGLGGFSSTGYYWSSTTSGTSYAYCKYFNNGEWFNTGRSSSDRVRAVRSFTLN